MLFTEYQLHFYLFIKHDRRKGERNRKRKRERERERERVGEFLSQSAMEM